jgi:hypothetical protein
VLERSSSTPQAEQVDCLQVQRPLIAGWLIQMNHSKPMQKLGIWGDDESCFSAARMFYCPAAAQQPELTT